MTFLIFISVVGLIVIIALKFLLAQKQGGIGSFRSRKFLLSKAEQAFYAALVPQLPPMRTVMVKVGLKDLVDVASSSQQQRRSDWGRIKSKHIDFVIMDASTSQIISCIELDDQSHNTAAAKQSDTIKNEVLKSAGIPLKRIRVGAGYTKEQIQTIL